RQPCDLGQPQQSTRKTAVRRTSDFFGTSPRDQRWENKLRASPSDVRFWPIADMGLAAVFANSIMVEYTMTASAKERGWLSCGTQMAAVTKVLIVGGGIAGMTLAIGLKRAGIYAEIIEINPQWSVLGVGISLQAPALRAFKMIDLLDQCMEIGFGYS